ncbi:MAG: hypothetical protein J7K89_02145 [Candidatus Cloacimonetes bacterium]|nr:hypothetical protein [Candidatus Cloacimonadota bacterium]
MWFRGSSIEAVPISLLLTVFQQYSHRLHLKSSCLQLWKDGAQRFYRYAALTASNPLPHLNMIIVHDDAVREFAYKKPALKSWPRSTTGCKFL